MNSLKRDAPDDIPREIQEYQKDDVRQMAVGSPGKVGILDLELQMNSRNERTVITRQYHQVPLQIQRVLYLEDTLPQMAYLYVISPSGGVLQGDRYKTDISLKNKAMAHMTTQGATRIYGMNSNFASQTLNITVDRGCYLEYIPEQIIPYKDARYYQNVNLNVHDDATLIYSEVLTPGRVAMNESFEYRICYIRTCCRDHKKKIRMLESAKIEPKRQALQKIGVLEEYQTTGTVYILTGKKREEATKEMEEDINKEFKERENILSGGTSVIPDESGIIVRILGGRTDDVFDLIFRIVQIGRKKILGAEFTKIRKN